MQAKKVIALTAAFVVAACSGGGYDPQPMPSPSTTMANAPVGWPIRTADYVDLWLHGYAMVTTDTAPVPLFDRGYRDRMIQHRRQLNVTTGLDANMQALRDGLARNPNLEQGQFAIFNFASWDEVLRVTRLFIQNEGSPSTVNDAMTQQLFGTLRSGFRTVAERDWLRLFVQSLDDERTKFYQSYWTAQQTDRAAQRRAVESAWNNTYKTKFQRYLRNERLIDGTFILSLPLGGEGRAIIGQQGNGIATAFPDQGDDAMEAIYVFVHEVAGNAAARALEDNLTPAQAREGLAAKLTPIAAVRAGAVILQRLSPDLLQGYQRFYLRQHGSSVPSGDPGSAFISAYSLPQSVADGIARQVDLVLAGI